ncbi:MAG: ribosome maturation factor RimM [Hyphomicrobium sp.]|nr:ribosome maturation factor RimM [Hyphomicrobium sp.]
MPSPSLKQADPAGRLVLLGEIGPAHGVRGEVIVRSYTADPADITAYGILTDETRRNTFQVSLVRVTPKGVVVRIAGHDDRTAVEKLRGVRLYVPRDRLPPPADGEFYHEDLIGLEATTPAGEVIGRVVAIQNFGAGDLVEIERAGAHETELIPFTEASVPEIDFAAGRMKVIPPDYVEGGVDVDDEP